MTQFLILRHASTAWNRDGRIQGLADVALSAEGLAEAGRWRLPPDTADWPCLSSPLWRAQETARAMGLAPIPVAALAETDWGRLEGRKLADVRREGGDDFAANEANGLDFRPPGGESPREVGARALAALDLAERNSVVVCHKGVLRALLAISTGWDMRAKPPLRLADACCHRFSLDPRDGLRLIEANISLVPAAPRATSASIEPFPETPA